MGIQPQDRKLTLTRSTITIKGTYTPQQKSPNGLILGATFRITNLHPDEAANIEITKDEWKELKRLYFEGLKGHSFNYDY